MAFTWQEAISQGSEIKQVDFSEIRDNIDYVHSNLEPCPSEHSSYYSEEESTHKGIDYTGYEDSDEGTNWNWYDGTYESTNNAGYDTDEEGTYYSLNYSVDDQNDHVTYFGFDEVDHNEDDEGLYDGVHCQNVYSVHQETD